MRVIPMAAAPIALALSLLCAGVAPAAEKPNVHIVATGGTIAGAQANVEQHGYTAGTFTVESLIQAVPELKDIAEVTGEQLVNIPSQDMNDEVWLKLAKRLNELLADPKVDGVVVTHGTDTMEETSTFIQLTVAGDKPVVFTGSMRPATAISADGPMNLYNAVAVAGDPAARGHGSLVVLNDEIHAARDVYKTHTTNVDTFRSPEHGLVGRIDTGHPTLFGPPPPRAETYDVGALTELPKVEIVYAHSNMGRTLIDAAVAAGAKGLVVAGVGNGNMTRTAVDALAEVAKTGVVVVRSTKLAEGTVVRNAEVDDDTLGFVVSDDFKPGKARALLQLALTRTADPIAIQKIFDSH